jgi:eukaryotic-like serine/threonine-protein kinase
MIYRIGRNLCRRVPERRDVMLRHETMCPICGGDLLGGRLAGMCPACAWQGLNDPLLDEVGDSEPFPTSGLFRVGSYEVMAEIARGGMGIVYCARQLTPKRDVALKMLLPHQLGSASVIERFRVEVRALAELSHPAILPVYESGDHNGMPYFTMKLAVGGSLAERTKRYLGRPREIAELTAALADAVQFAHERGVLHRDLKPGNILFDEENRAYVSDFGLAKLAGGEMNLTRTTDFLGTPHYLAPEVAAASARAATTSSDIYALGAVLYELLAGRLPFEAEGAPALLKKITETEPPWIASAPRDLGIISLKALSKDPRRRYATAGELAEDLRRWLHGRTILARPAGPLERAWAWARRKPGLAALSIALGGALVTTGVLEARNQSHLRAALAESRLAQQSAQQSLQRSLVEQARARRQSGTAGQRFDSLELLRRAAEIQPSLAARNEAAASLAISDLQTGPREPSVFFANGTSTLDYSADLTRCLAGHPEGGFALRAAGEKKELIRFSDNQLLPHILRFSPSERLGLVSYANGSAEVWELEAKRRVWHYSQSEGPIVAVLLHNDAEIAVARSNGGVETHHLSNQTRRQLAPPGPRVGKLSVSADGQLIAIARRNTLEVRRVDTGELQWTAPGDFTAAEPTWSPEGRHLAGGSGANGEICVWDATNGEVKRRLQAESHWPAMMTFHPDGWTLASLSADRALRFWDIRTGGVRLKSSAAPRVLRFAADGRRMALAPEHLFVSVAEFPPSAVWREFANPVFRNERPFGLAVSADTLLAATCGRSGISLWDTRKGEWIDSIENELLAGSSVHFHPDGRSLIYSAAGRGIYRRSYRMVRGEGDVRARVEFGEPEQLGTAADGLLTAIGRDGRQWILEDRVQGRVILWPGGKREEARALISGERFNGAMLSPDGRWLATRNAPLGGITIWNAATGAKARELELAEAHAACAFSPDGSWLLTGTATDYRVWNAGTWEPGHGWAAALGGRPKGQMFISPGGESIAVRRADDALQIVDGRDFREVVTLTPPTPIEIVDAAWTPDRAKLFVLGAGHRLYEWNVATLRDELLALGLSW